MSAVCIAIVWVATFSKLSTMLFKVRFRESLTFSLSILILDLEQATVDDQNRTLVRNALRAIAGYFGLPQWVCGTLLSKNTQVGSVANY
jgi:hypothetical protein